MNASSQTETRCHLRCFLCGFLLVCLFWCFRSKEPAYQGKKLSQWMDELPDLLEHEWNADTPIPAREALHNIGIKAIPHLLKRIQTRDWALKSKLIELDERYDLPVIHFKRATLRQCEAARGFRLLGPKGVSALPALEHLLHQGDDPPGFVAWAMAGIGSEAVALLTNAPTNRNHKVRKNAAFALGTVYAADRNLAVPALIEFLRDTNELVRLHAICSLGNIGKGPDLVVPALIERLADQHIGVRRSAITSLAQFGSQAKAAVPALLKLTDNEQELLRSGAASPLVHIEPEAAPKTVYDCGFCLIANSNADLGVAPAAGRCARRIKPRRVTHGSRTRVDTENGKQVRKTGKFNSINYRSYFQVYWSLLGESVKDAFDDAAFDSGFPDAQYLKIFGYWGLGWNQYTTKAEWPPP